MTTTFTLPDLINLAVLIATAIGVFAAFRQIFVSNKQKRADLILQLCNQFYQDNDMQEVYYKIEYGEFRYSVETFHQSDEEKKLDKLLSLFSNIGQLFQMGLVKTEDLEFIKYEIQVIYENSDINSYFKTLDKWFEARQISHLKFQPFRDLGKVITKNNYNDK